MGMTQRPQVFLLLAGQDNNLLNRDSITIKNIHNVFFSDYNHIKYENDISLLKLAVPVVYTDYILPACLPTHGYEVTVELKCSISGWGDTRSKQNLINDFETSCTRAFFDSNKRR